MKKIFFIGVGGVGVSSLAQYYLARGWQVAGSDAATSEITRDLAARGVAITTQDDIAAIVDADLVIHTTAVTADQPQLAEAHRLGIPTQTYPENVGELTQQFRTIAVAGAHGKSTTTAMLAHILIAAGLDPTVIIGTKVPEFGQTNFRDGQSDLLLLEADEYKGAFWHYHAQIAVVLNLDIEHLDFYRDANDIKSSFTRFLDNMAADGTIIVNGQNHMALDIVTGLATRAHKVVFNQVGVAHHDLQVPGQHNQANAEAAAQAARALGVDAAVIERSLHSFQNTWRRLEQIVPRIYSDYAHHPTEIAATLQALRERYPHKRLIAVCQPFQKDRLNRLFDQYLHCFDQADETYLVPTFVVLGRDRSDGRDSADLVTAIDRPNVIFSPSVEQAFAQVQPAVTAGAVAVFLGNGDIDARLRQLASTTELAS